MPISLLDRLPALDRKVKIPKVVLPDFDRFIQAETPAIAVQLAPALEDLVQLTDGVPTDLPQQIKDLLTSQAEGSLPGAVVVDAVVGERPDYTLLRADPKQLPPEDRTRRAAELAKLLNRRQNYGIFLAEPGRSGDAGRQKGVGLLNLSPDTSVLMAGTGAPFSIEVRLQDIEAAANAVIAADAPRYGLAGEECACGPVSVTSLEIRNPEARKVEIAVLGKIDLLLGAVHSGFQLRIAETVAESGGVLADPAATANIDVLQIVGANMPDKLKKALERDIVKALLLKIFPVGTLLKLGLRALASRLATNKLNESEEPQGPIHEALSKVMAPQLISATDKKVQFELDRATAANSVVKLAGTVLVVDREQSLGLAQSAFGLRAGGSGSREFDIKFRANPVDLAEPVTYTWTCGGVEQVTGSLATFRVDLAASPEVAVSVRATDRDGFEVPEVAATFSQSGSSVLGVIRLRQN